MDDNDKAGDAMSEAIEIDRSVVPCAGCTLCCQNDAIFVHPELGDDASQYKTQKYHGLDIIKHLANGQCYYLNLKFGCTIHAPCLWLDVRTGRCREHHYRPNICREFEVGCERCNELRVQAGLDPVGAAP